MKDRESLEKDLDNYIRIMQASNVDAALNYIYPGLYKLIPREALAANFKASFKNSDFNDYIDGFFISDISKPVEVGDSVFYKVKYVINLRTDPYSGLVKQVLDGEDVNYDILDFRYKAMDALLAAYGEGNVKYDEGEACFKIQLINEMLAIYQEGFDTWKFIKYSKGSIYRRMFPAKTLKKLATHFFIMD